MSLGIGWSQASPSRSALVEPDLDAAGAQSCCDSFGGLCGLGRVSPEDRMRGVAIGVLNAAGVSEIMSAA